MNVNEHLGYTNGELSHCYAFVFLLYGLAEIFNFVNLNHFQVIPSLNSGGNLNVKYYSVLLEYIHGYYNYLSNLLLSVAGFLQVDKLLR